MANCVHPSNPLHLIGSFQLLCHTITGLQLVYQLVKHMSCRPVDFLQLVSQLAAKEYNPDAKAKELQMQNEQEMQKQQEVPKAMM